MFEGGIHPPYAKDISANKKIEKFPLPERLVIPVAQHIGAPSAPIVAVGDLVKKGQPITVPGGFISAPVHASSSGKVIGIVSHPHPSGKPVTSIVIETDGKDEWADDLKDTISAVPSDFNEIKSRILKAGIVGLGGATFPTHVKLSPPKDKKIEYILLNGAECEPYLTCDYRIMVEMPEDIIKGLQIVMDITNVEKAFIGVEDNKPEAIENLNKASADYDGIGIKSLETKYPQGGEKMLIKAILDKEVPMGCLPMEVGVIVLNVGTAAAIYHAAAYNRPLVERVVTVTGSGIVEPKNLMVPIGTPASEVIEYCGGLKDSAKKIIFGGPMMGGAQFDTDLPIIKGVSGILILCEDEVENSISRPCIGCGKCVGVCPMGLLPSKLSICGEALGIDQSEEYYPFQCMECGCCSYVCPSKRPIVQYIKYLKLELGKKAKAAAK